MLDEGSGKRKEKEKRKKERKRERKKEMVRKKYERNILLGLLI